MFLQQWPWKALPAELIVNLDQTGIRTVPCSTWTIDRQGWSKFEGLLPMTNTLSLLFLRDCIWWFPASASNLQKHDPTLSPSLYHSPRMACRLFCKSMLNRRDHVTVCRPLCFPYLAKTRELFGDNTFALVIMDNFKGQMTKSLFLFWTGIMLICLLPPNTILIDHL